MKLEMKWALIAAAAASGLLGQGAQAASAAPDLSGYWAPDKPVEKLTTIDGKTPPLKPEARTAYRQTMASKAKGDLSFDPAAQCVSAGIPRLLYMPYPFEIVQSPKRTAMLFAWNRIYRLIETARRAPDADYPYKVGVSDGRWRGQELIVNTRDIDPTTVLDGEGLPHSDKLKVTEAYRLSADGRALSNIITIDDPQTFTRPWRTRITYHRMPADYLLPEDICLDRTDAGRPAIE